MSIPSLINLKSHFDDVTYATEIESLRAQNAEQVLTTNLAAEVTRATNAENSITSSLNAEITRAQNAEQVLTTNLTAEVTRATNAENSITSSLNAEITRAQNAEQVLTTNLAAEVTRATNAENSITSSLNAEITRAQNAENLEIATRYAQDQLRLALTGGVVTGETTFDGGIILNGATTSYQGPTQTVNLADRANTYIAFKPAGSANDWAYLRQIGGDNQIHITLDFHDDETDGRFSIGRVGSSQNQTRTTLFQVDNTDIQMFRPLIIDGTISTTSFLSGQTMISQVGIVSEGILDPISSNPYQVTVNNASIPPVVNGSAPNLTMNFYYNLRSTTDPVVVHLFTNYTLNGHGTDYIELQVYEGIPSEPFELKHVHQHKWTGNYSGGGTRSSTLFPIFFVYTPSTAGLGRLLSVSILNYSNDTITIGKSLQVHLTQIKS